MERSPDKEIWIHALGAKAGGGITYLRAVLPEIVDLLDGAGVRVVLLVAGPVDGGPLPPWLEVRPMPRAATGNLSRLVFDQIVLPLWLSRRPNAVLFCSGSYSPVLKTVPTVALLRNAIYFDQEFLEREDMRRRLQLRVEGWLIARGARGCRSVLYPSDAMRRTVESCHPRLAKAGAVAPYGVGGRFLEARGAGAPRAGVSDEWPSFLYVMNYTLQKNLTTLLEALAIARARGVGVRVVVTSWLEDGPAASAARDRALIEDNELVESGYLKLVGPTFGDDLIALYRSVDGCVFPSICESFGHPLVEAMAVGKPVVCADRPYARELCGENALYADPNDPERFVEIWERWPEIAATWRPISLEDVKDRFSWRRHVERLLESLGVGVRDENAMEQEYTRV